MNYDELKKGIQTMPVTFIPAFLASSWRGLHAFFLSDIANCRSISQDVAEKSPGVVNTYALTSHTKFLPRSTSRWIAVRDNARSIGRSRTVSCKPIQRYEK